MKITGRKNYSLAASAMVAVLSLLTQKELSGGAARPVQLTVDDAQAIEAGQPQLALQAERINDLLKSLDIYLRTQPGVNYGNNSQTVTISGHKKN